MNVFHGLLFTTSVLKCCGATWLALCNAHTHTHTHQTLCGAQTCEPRKTTSAPQLLDCPCADALAQMMRFSVVERRLVASVGEARRRLSAASYQKFRSAATGCIAMVPFPSGTAVFSAGPIRASSSETTVLCLRLATTPSASLISALQCRP